MVYKQPTISSEYEVKDRLVIGQYGASFNTFLEKMQIMKIEMVQEV